MRITESTPAVLLLQDGTLFHGKALGKIGTHGGEICFNTGMTGYQEIYTDPSYAGQVIINTTAHIGNYGVISEGEAESDQVQIAGMVCNEFASVHSRSTSDGSLQDYLANAGIVGISGIDTRALVRHIRTKGVMNCLISSEIFDEVALKAALDKIPSMEGLELSSQVCTQEAYFLGDEKAERKRVSDLQRGLKPKKEKVEGTRRGRPALDPEVKAARELEKVARAERSGGRRGRPASGVTVKTPKTFLFRQIETDGISACPILTVLVTQKQTVY